MIIATVRKVGDDFEVTIPEEEVLRLGLAEGQAVSVELRALTERDRLRPEVRKAFEESWERNERGYRYLSER